MLKTNKEMELDEESEDQWVIVDDDIQMKMPDLPPLRTVEEIARLNELFDPITNKPIVNFDEDWEDIDDVEIEMEYSKWLANAKKAKKLNTKDQEGSGSSNANVRDDCGAGMDTEGNDGFTKDCHDDAVTVTENSCLEEPGDRNQPVDAVQHDATDAEIIVMDVDSNGVVHENIATERSMFADKAPMALSEVSEHIDVDNSQSGSTTHLKGCEPAKDPKAALIVVDDSRSAWTRLARFEQAKGSKTTPVIDDPLEVVRTEFNIPLYYSNHRTSMCPPFYVPQCYASVEIAPNPQPTKVAVAATGKKIGRPKGSLSKKKSTPKIRKSHAVPKLIPISSTACVHSRPGSPPYSRSELKGGVSGLLGLASELPNPYKKKPRIPYPLDPPGPKRSTTVASTSPLKNSNHPSSKKQLVRKIFDKMAERVGIYFIRD